MNKQKLIIMIVSLIVIGITGIILGYGMVLDIRIIKMFVLFLAILQLSYIGEDIIEKLLFKLD